MNARAGATAAQVSMLPLAVTERATAESCTRSATMTHDHAQQPQARAGGAGQGVLRADLDGGGEAKLSLRARSASSAIGCPIGTSGRRRSGRT